MSCVKAAEELHVSPAAVSQQLRALESLLGVALFYRKNRRLVLTQEAQKCLPEITEGFAKLSAAVERLRSADSSERLSVSVAPSFGLKWLMPRLHLFYEAYPDIDLSVSTNSAHANFVEDKVNLAVRFGTGKFPGLVTIPLIPLSVFPVCSPRLVANGQLRSPDDVRHHVLLHDESLAKDPSCPSWTQWCNINEVDGFDARRGPRVDHAYLAIDAAIAGRGIAMGRSALVADDIRAGRLVRPFKDAYQGRCGYFIVHPEESCQSRTRDAFSNWLMQQVAQEGLDAERGARRMS